MLFDYHYIICAWCVHDDVMPVWFQCMMMLFQFMICGSRIFSVPLSISTQPLSNARLVGESVVLCCSATGSPLPTYYEWYVNLPVPNSIEFKRNPLWVNNELIYIGSILTGAC